MEDKNKSYEQLKEERKNFIHISYSEFSLYSDCGHRHLIDKYLGLTPFITSIHLLFGNAIHSALEYGLKHGYNLEKRTLHFKEQFVKGMMDNLKESDEYKQLDNFVAQGENILKLLSTEQILEKYDLVGVEEQLYEVLMDGFYFKGFIDLIVKHKTENKYIIIDYKTSTEMWDVNKKKKDPVFMSQMRFYKHFFSTKFKVPLENIECKYLVLNRLKSKKLPELGFGTIQPVEIFSNKKEINESLELIKEVVENIHFKKIWTKAKLTGRKQSCFFCPFKNDANMCDEDANQYIELIEEHKNKKPTVPVQIIPVSNMINKFSAEQIERTTDFVIKMNDADKVRWAFEQGNEIRNEGEYIRNQTSGKFGEFGLYNELIKLEIETSEVDCVVVPDEWYDDQDMTIYNRFPIGCKAIKGNSRLLMLENDKYNSEGNYLRSKSAGIGKPYKVYAFVLVKVHFDVYDQLEKIPNIREYIQSLNPRYEVCGFVSRKDLKKYKDNNIYDKKGDCIPGTKIKQKVDNMIWKSIGSKNLLFTSGANIEQLRPLEQIKQLEKINILIN